MKEKTERNEEIKSLKASGMSVAEISERYGISKAMTYRICKGINVPDREQAYKNQYTSGAFDQIANIKRLLREANPTFEYVSGFKNVDSYITIRCKNCGHTMQRSAATIRHKHVTQCPGCKAIAEQEKKAAKEELEAARKQAREKREKEREEELAALKLLRLHKCPVCGTPTTRRKYCSHRCARKADNARHEVKRRTKIMAVMVDSDITLEKLYERDGGVCWICGMMCEWEDKTSRGDAFIAGEYYPSIDHVVALADGGEHSWANVKLAHRKCNTYRYTEDHGKGVC